MILNLTLLMIDSLSEVLLKNGITILIALLAGLIALIQVKSNVISSARIRWINEFRESISYYCQLAMKTRAHFSNKSSLKEKSSEEGYFMYLDSLAEYYTVKNKLALYLSSEKKTHKDILEIITKISRLVSKKEIEKDDFDNIDDLCRELVSQSRSLIDCEWKKSKKLFKL